MFVALTVALGMMLTPFPEWTPGWLGYFQVPAVVYLLVCYLGKLLYDTFFYERYPR